MSHPTHKTRMSDSTLYDEVCTFCNKTDTQGLDEPCSKANFEWLEEVNSEQADELSAWRKWGREQNVFYYKGKIEGGK